MEITTIPPKVKTPIPKPVSDYSDSEQKCNHKWKKVIKFIRVFEYCVKCNEKKDIK